jgi:hypothetical protein
VINGVVHWFGLRQPSDYNHLFCSLRCVLSYSFHVVDIDQNICYTLCNGT